MEKYLHELIATNLPSSAYRLVLALSIEDSYAERLSRETGMTPKQAWATVHRLKELGLVEPYPVGGKRVFYKIPAPIPLERGFAESIVRERWAGLVFRVILALSIEDNYNKALARMLGLINPDGTKVRTDQSKKALKLLEERGLVTPRREGKRIYYHLNQEFPGDEPTE
jgi:hypothetical protein